MSSPGDGRRRFLQAIAAAALGIPSTRCLFPQAWSGRSTTRLPPCRFVDQFVADAHREIIGARPQPAEIEPGTFDTIVFGGGIAGLSAAWKLERSGLRNYLLLEGDEHMGGTSKLVDEGERSLTWGAHYLLMPPPEGHCLHELLGDLAIIRGYDRGKVIVAEEHVVEGPETRTLSDTVKPAAWTYGVLPVVDAREARLRRRMLLYLRSFRYKRGSDGKRLFSLPTVHSSSDPSYRSWERFTARDFLTRRGYQGKFAFEAIHDSGSDDYGGFPETVSAWAIIHYYSSRTDLRILSWKEGNGYLVKLLLGKIPAERRRTGLLATLLEPDGEGVTATVYDRAARRFLRLRARTVIFAGKKHVAMHIIHGLPPDRRAAFAECRYPPWLVANVFLTRPPASPPGQARLTWDNSRALGFDQGYTVQNRRWRQPGFAGPMVLTYFIPLIESASGRRVDLEAARREVLLGSPEEFGGRVADELERMHPGITAIIERIDMQRWGHAMAVPAPDFLFGPQSRLRREPLGRIHFANSDSSLLPLFEEAAYDGIRAAQAVMGQLGHRCVDSIKVDEPPPPERVR